MAAFHVTNSSVHWVKSLYSTQYLVIVEGLNQHYDCILMYTVTARVILLLKCYKGSNRMVILFGQSLPLAIQTKICPANTPVNFQYPVKAACTRWRLIEAIKLLDRGWGILFLFVFLLMHAPLESCKELCSLENYMAASQINHKSAVTLIGLALLRKNASTNNLWYQ